MILDPFLIAHRVGGGEFDMAGKYSPAAVRDQMNRAVAIVERAVRAGLLNSSHHLLIKGGGAAGVSAAMQAVKCGVGAVTISRQKHFFDRQRNSNRILDPVEYDWPAEGWQQGDTPSTRVPLPYARGRARDIVIRQWDPAWAAFRAQYEGRNPRVADSGEGEQKFDRILDCTGPGIERTRVGDYIWYEFWQDNMLESPGSDFPTVLISGGGDGAPQDFLRILFPGTTPRDIYLALQLDVPMVRILLIPVAVIASAQPGYDAAPAAKLKGGERGMKKYVITFLKRGPTKPKDPAEAQSLQAAHMANISRMANEGKLLVAGPFPDNGDFARHLHFQRRNGGGSRGVDPHESFHMELHPWYGSAALREVVPLHEKIVKKAAN